MRVALLQSMEVEPDCEQAQQVAVAPAVGEAGVHCVDLPALLVDGP